MAVEVGFSLKKSLVRQYWENKDKKIYSIFKKLENYENWVADEDKDVEMALAEFIVLVEQKNKEFVHRKIPEILDVMAYLNMSKVMRWLNRFDEKFEDAFSLNFVETAATIVKQNPNDFRKKIMLERLQIIRAYDQLSRIYDEKRLERINKVLKELSK